MLHRLGLLDALRAFRAGSATPADYMAACLAAVREREGALHAFVHLADGAPAARPGPLGGVPVGVKDIIATADMPTRNGSRVDAPQPSEDAAVVARIRARGGWVIGKTVTTEYAWRHPGPTVNPHNPAHTPGGSSQGSAAAVAAGLLPLALGTQTLGSVIRPAAFCGAVGLKPSFGLIPREGVTPFADSLDHVGVFTRSVDDAAYALGELASDRAGFAVSVEEGLPPLEAPRIALLATPHDDKVEPHAAALLQNVAERLRAAGAVVEPLRLPKAFDAAYDAVQTIATAEGAHQFRPLAAAHPDKVSTPLKAMAEAGAAIPALDYIEARETQRTLAAAFGPALAGFDAVLTVPAPGEAPRGLDWTGDATFCMAWTLLGTPAITLPSGRGPAGLPLGIQLVAPRGGDYTLLRVAKWVETQVGA